MTSGKKPFDGVQAVADMMNMLDDEHRQRILNELAQREPATAAKIREQMFTFEDVAKLDSARAQELLKQIPQGRLALAMRSTTETMKTFIYGNLSERAAGFLREEIAAMGPQKLTDVTHAQSDIAAMAKALLNKS